MVALNVVASARTRTAVAIPITVNTEPRTAPRVARPRPRSPVRAICLRATTPSTIATGDTMKATTTETHDERVQRRLRARRHRALGLVGPIGPGGPGPKPAGGDGGATCDSGGMGGHPAVRAKGVSVPGAVVSASTEVSTRGRRGSACWRHDGCSSSHRRRRAAGPRYRHSSYNFSSSGSQKRHLIRLILLTLEIYARSARGRTSGEV